MAAINPITSQTGSILQQYRKNSTASVTPTTAPADAAGNKTKTDSASFSQEALQAQNTAQTGTKELSQQEQQEVKELQKTDREVRQHEQAHMSAAGGYARGGAHFTYTTGPDGKRYATGGEVSIDVSPGNTPEATIQKMETVKRAATAPANPSAQDRSVYASASRTEQQARAELAKEKAQNGGEAAPNASSSTASLLDITA